MIISQHIATMTNRMGKLGQQFSKIYLKETSTREMFSPLVLPATWRVFFSPPRDVRFEILGG